jgi:hypothetical protein
MLLMMTAVIAQNVLLRCATTVSELERMILIARIIVSPAT